MRALGPAELLQSWEAGTTQPRWLWARNLVAALRPELSGAEVDALTIGARDALLLELREALFGSQLTGRSECPACRAPVELELSTAELRATSDERFRQQVDPAVLRGLEHPSPRTSPTGTSGSTSTPTFRVLTDDGEIRFRVPTAGDVAAAARAHDVATMRSLLLERCVLDVTPAETAIDVRQLPTATLERVIEGMSAADPQADCSLELSCPECRHHWSETFDIVSFLWAELDAWALRLLHDVHTLASAYGWSEAQVLALSAPRRARYLEMISV